MKRYGLIGYPLGHSFSARYFADKFAREGIADCRYDLYELKTIEELPALLEAQPELRGFNVTIPYKQQIIPYLDDLSPETRMIGACLLYTSPSPRDRQLRALRRQTSDGL